MRLSGRGRLFRFTTSTVAILKKNTRITFLLVAVGDCKEVWHCGKVINLFPGNAALGLCTRAGLFGKK